MAATVTPAGWDNIAITTLCFEALPRGASVKPGFFAAGLCCTGCFEREWRTRDALGFPDFDERLRVGIRCSRCSQPMRLHIPQTKYLDLDPWQALQLQCRIMPLDIVRDRSSFREPVRVAAPLAFFESTYSVEAIFEAKGNCRSYDRIADASLVRVVSMDARLIPRVEHDSEQFSCSFGYGTMGIRIGIFCAEPCH